tara:strand:- start:978 stop:1748 length:771 start_codon:yes stop_codon:yes gene_type:complete
MDYNKKLNKIYNNSKLSKRINSYTGDEPLTIEWIESFEKNSIFYDIGSNIGGYSFIASFNSNVKTIYSFEPNLDNFYSQIIACRNNDIKNIHPFNLAVNNNNTFNFFKYDRGYNPDKLNYDISEKKPIYKAGSKGTFGEELKDQMIKSDYSNPFKRGITWETGIIGISLDSLVYEFNMPIPNYLKIDVDGNDFLVLSGAERLLNEPNVKEIFIEIDDKIYQDGEIEKFMLKYSFNIEKNINVGSEDKPMRMVLYKK